MSVTNVESRKVYQFNNSVARVVMVTEDTVIWRDQKTPRKDRVVPRWYFEKYATAEDGGIAT
jgi:hypothetical protein